MAKRLLNDTFTEQELNNVVKHSRKKPCTKTEIRVCFIIKIHFNNVKNNLLPLNYFIQKNNTRKTMSIKIEIVQNQSQTFNFNNTVQ